MVINFSGGFSMKKYVLLCALVCGLAVTSTSEVQTHVELLAVFSFNLLTAGLIWPVSTIIFGSQAVMRDLQEISTSEKVMIRATLILIPINVVSVLCYFVMGALSLLPDILHFGIVFVFATSLVALIGLTVGNIIFNTGKALCKLFSGKRMLSKRKQRKRARHRKKQKKLAMQAAVV